MSRKKSRRNNRATPLLKTTNPQIASLRQSAAHVRFGRPQAALSQLWSRTSTGCLQFWSALCAISIWSCLDAAGDMLTVGFAVFDIIMDVWIAYTYYCDGRTGFLKLGLGLLGIAQISYAFLFVVVFCSGGQSTLQGIFWFFVVLPFGQLVPLFVYAESLDFEWLDAKLRSLGLSSSQTPRRCHTEDLMMYKIRCKVVSHIGFLVEACVEAVPQSVLQLVAMQHAGEANALSVLSIMLSISCLASKGYVASFSIHFRTFVFGAMCVAADVLNMFASAAWLSSPAVLTPAAASACSCWVHLASLTAIFLGVFALLIALREQCKQHWDDWSRVFWTPIRACLLYTSDAADEEDSVDLGGRRILNKKTTVILS
eukprot:TRINITY_DN1191_c0_g1_i3.p1 TRINITY_DN1191_c0_g1~~TRINITY_DN1191_c0_g1_i3.p1  ORF type:complete len:370 (-),score=56.38 TRINITY_DN1191_c0_g1_i3:72-1181(-)